MLFLIYVIFTWAKMRIARSGDIGDAASTDFRIQDVRSIATLTNLELHSSIAAGCAFRPGLNSFPFWKYNSCYHNSNFIRYFKVLLRIIFQC